MNAPIGTKNRPWRARISAINGESATSIVKGNVVCLDSGDLGKVKLPSGSGGVTVAHPLFAGVAVSDAAPGQPVEITAAGYVTEAIFLRRTRAATTDSYASIAAMAIGNQLTIDTVNNCFAYSTVGAAAMYPVAAVLLESIASSASTASHTSLTALAQTTKVKVFIRALG
jgi:hypothetical protein